MGVNFCPVTCTIVDDLRVLILIPRFKFSRKVPFINERQKPLGVITFSNKIIRLCALALRCLLSISQICYFLGTERWIPKSSRHRGARNVAKGQKLSPLCLHIYWRPSGTCCEDRDSWMKSTLLYWHSDSLWWQIDRCQTVYYSFQLRGKMHRRLYGASFVDEI